MRAFCSSEKRGELCTGALCSGRYVWGVMSGDVMFGALCPGAFGPGGGVSSYNSGSLAPHQSF